MIHLKIAAVFLKTAESAVRVLNRNKEKRLLAKKSWAEILLQAFSMKVTIAGVPPQNGACLLVGNHISYLDIAVLMEALPEVIFIAKRELLFWPIVGPGAAAAGTIFVKRASGSDRRSVRTQVLKRFKEDDQKIVVFPSGTTRLSEDKLWKKGIFEIAKEAGVPVQLFKIEYEPLRPAAFIDDDNLIDHMRNLLKFKNNRVKLTWLAQYAHVTEPAQFAEELRIKVRGLS